MQVEDEGRTYRIGELASLFGVTGRTIRYYEELGLLEAAGRQDGAHRKYHERNVIYLKRIQQLKDYGLTLAEIRELFDLARRDRSGETVGRKLADKYREKLEEAERRKRALDGLHRRPRLAPGAAGARPGLLPMSRFLMRLVPLLRSLRRTAPGRGRLEVAYLCFDIGSSTLKAAVLSEDGSLLGLARRQLRSSGEGIGVDPLAWAESAFAAGPEALAAARIAPRAPEIRGISVSGHGPTLSRSEPTAFPSVLPSPGSTEAPYAKPKRYLPSPAAR